MLEAHARVDDLHAHLVVRRQYAHAGQNAVSPARQQLKRGDGLFQELRLHQDTPAQRDDGVSRQNEGIGDIAVIRDLIARGLRLGTRQPLNQRARHFSLVGRFVDRRRAQGIGVDADLGQKRKPAG